MEIKNLIKTYNDLLEQGASIFDLYIYDELTNNDLAGDYTEIELARKIEKVKEKYARDYGDRSIEYFVNEILEGDYDIEEDSEW